MLEMITPLPLMLIFSLFYILLVLIVLFILFLIVKDKKTFLKALGIAFSSMLVLFVILLIYATITKTKVLDKNDYYGEYIIDRNYFAGKQADWQYNHYRFKIKENDSIYLYETNGRKIIKTHKGKISTIAPVKSARLRIHMKEPKHHIMHSNPTIYRETWDFYLVFDSPKFSNMYFRKGKWKNID